MLEGALISEAAEALRELANGTIKLTLDMCTFWKYLHSCVDDLCGPIALPLVPLSTS